MKKEERKNLTILLNEFFQVLIRHKIGRRFLDRLKQFLQYLTAYLKTKTNIFCYVKICNIKDYRKSCSNSSSNNNNM